MLMDKSAAKFITLEGGEGVGKSTNLAYVENYLETRNIKYIVTREPGGTPLAEDVRKLLLSEREEAVDENCELLLVFAARAQHINQVILPNLLKGVWVLCDRFTDATYAYQGYGRGLSLDKISQLESLVQDGLRPDLTILLDAPVAQGMERVKQRGALDRFEKEQLAFFQRVRDGYLERASSQPERIKCVDASQSLTDVQSQLQGVLDDCFR